VVDSIIRRGRRGVSRVVRGMKSVWSVVVSVVVVGVRRGMR